MCIGVCVCMFVIGFVNVHIHGTNLFFIQARLCKRMSLYVCLLVCFFSFTHQRYCRCIYANRIESLCACVRAYVCMFASAIDNGNIRVPMWMNTSIRVCISFYILPISVITYVHVRTRVSISVHACGYLYTHSWSNVCV